MIHVDAEEQFLAKLAGVTDPEKKRKIIGAEFIEVFDAEEKKLTNAKWLAQGTIYPDVNRIRRRENQKSPRHQIPPQCRRSA